MTVVRDMKMTAGLNGAELSRSVTFSVCFHFVLLCTGSIPALETASRPYLGQNSFDAADAGATRRFFEDFESLTLFKELQRVVNVRTTADFEAERLICAVCDHLVHLDCFAVTITKLT